MKLVLITGANGEIGHSLIRALTGGGKADVVALDLHPIDPDLAGLCRACYQGDIRDRDLINEIGDQHQFTHIFHMAGLLSASGEKKPELAHEVNVNGSFNILRLARRQSSALKRRVVVLFTSSIAVYGLRDHDDVEAPVSEREYLTPRTMYGMNKLYVEQVGRYFSEFYQSPDGDVPIDFRGLRFPGLISPDTLPSGGTTDFGPEMLHAAAQGKPYTSFVDAQTTLPFMVMGDAVRSLIQLASAPRDALRHQIYNVTSFSASAEQIRRLIQSHFPAAEIGFQPVEARQRIVDSWPRRLDDGPAREDWGWSPRYGFEAAFADVLVPRVCARYKVSDEPRSV